MYYVGTTMMYKCMRWRGIRCGTESQTAYLPQTLLHVVLVDRKVRSWDAVVLIGDNQITPRLK